MREYSTPAVVIGQGQSVGNDRFFDVFTKDLGKIRIKAVSALKISSKLSPHLDALNLVDLRVVRKGNGFVVADVLTKERFRELRDDNALFGKALKILFLLRSVVPAGEADLRLWYELLGQFNEKAPSSVKLLGILGYDPGFADCESCRSGNAAYFYCADQCFVCAGCAAGNLGSFFVELF